MSGFGLKVGEEKLSCLLYADDIGVVSESEQELQMMLEIVDGYSRDFKIKFGGDKSKVMVINGDETDRDGEWNIGEVKIGRIKGYKYLGCMLSDDGCARAKGEICKYAEKVMDDMDKGMVILLQGGNGLLKN
ncbi:Reverse transcriptase domain [Trinorchestia longiramus]|nr:Reverse transcriptase domain [Trinorchestia longiramus]